MQFQDFQVVYCTLLLLPLLLLVCFDTGMGFGPFFDVGGLVEGQSHGLSERVDS